MSKKQISGMYGFSPDNKQKIYVSYQNYDSEVEFVRDVGDGELRVEEVITMRDLIKLLRSYRWERDS